MRLRAPRGVCCSMSCSGRRGGVRAGSRGARAGAPGQGPRTIAAMTRHAAALFDPPWQRHAAAGVPSVGHCDVWRIDLDAVEGVEPALRGDGPLDAAELARAARFAFERDGRRFVAARVALRHILGMALRRDPAALVLEAPPLLRPRLAGDPGLDFNLSHSGRLALVAVAQSAPLGVDVEEWRPVPDAIALSARLFTPGERAALAADPRCAFLTCWTRKEAVLKSTGRGLSVEPCTVEVGATPEPRGLRFADRGSAQVDGEGGEVPLCVRSFAVGSDGVGAIALPPGAQVARWLHGLPA